VSPDSLANLDELVRSFVDDGEIVGAELLVIKNGKSILHEAYGSRNLKTETAMETGSVFCVRSMTKPFIGASVMLLVDQKKIKLSDFSRRSRHGRGRQRAGRSSHQCASSESRQVRITMGSPDSYRVSPDTR
jgi:hypothetical protein